MKYKMFTDLFSRGRDGLLGFELVANTSMKTNPKSSETYEVAYA